MKADEKYHVVFRHRSAYHVASSEAPDMHTPCFSKEDALLEARKGQLRLDGDPNFILDLTNVENTELTSYLR